MALINCPGCAARISDKALACPKCGRTKESEGSNTENSKAFGTSEEEVNVQKKSLSKTESDENINVWLLPLIFFLTVFSSLLIFVALPPETWVECGEKYENENGRVVRKRC